MIVRQVLDRHYIIRQPDHARQSGVIAAHLRDEFLGDPARRWELLLATSRHDDGWIPWESNPVYTPSGLPRNFSDIDKDRHIANWTRGIFTLLTELGPFSASLLARHAFPLVKEKGEETAAYFAELLAALEKRAHLTLAPEEAALRTRHAAAALTLADLVSLVACAGWKEPHTTEAYRADNTPVNFTVRLVADWTVTVSPWPFETESIVDVAVPARVIPHGEESTASKIITLYSQPTEQVSVSIHPGDSTP